MPCKLPVKLPENILPVNRVADIEVSPVIVDANVKLSFDSVTKLVPAKSVNKLAYVIFLLPDVASPASSFTKNLSVDAKSVFTTVGNDGVAVTPVNPAPLPLKDPVNEPVKIELAPVNCIDVVPVIVVPLSVKLELANAVPVHFIILFVVRAEAPLTATVVAEEPLYVNDVIPVPCVNELPTAPAPGVKDAVKAYDALSTGLVEVKIAPVTYDAVDAWDAFKAYEALVEPEAYDADLILLNPKGPSTLDELIYDAVPTLIDPVLW